MKKIWGSISSVVMVAMAALSCAQTADKKEANPSASTPELRWKYETGG